MADQATTPAVETAPVSAPVANQAPTARALKLPEIISAIGEVTSISKLSTDRGTIILMSLQNAKAEIITVSSSEGYWKKVGEANGVVEGSVVSISYEERIKGRTGYAPSEGAALVEHTGSGNNLSRLVKSSKASFEREVVAQGRGSKANEALSILAKQEVDLQGHAATLLGLIYSK